MFDFIKEFWWVIVFIVILLAVLVVVIVMACNGAGGDFDVVEWNTSPVNPASPNSIFK